jgi:RNA polymerase sigma-70 factor (ECF subfamily)
MSRRERRLIEALRARHRSAYVAAVERHYRSVYSLLRRLCGDTALAEDLTQEAFAAAWSHLDQFSGRSSLTTWLHRIALNVWRQQQRRAQPCVESWQGADLERVAAPEAPPLARLERQELRQRAERALLSLAPPYREVIVLRVQQGLKHREIAEVMGVPVGTIQCRVHVALRKLREALSEEVDGHGLVLAAGSGEAQDAL